ncbi:MAG: hypothetical protein JST00_21405 [Deltaproteobacteria bacterium]|nr:hypothetical protein [Deltaproteobacteria bacterium]
MALGLGILPLLMVVLGKGLGFERPSFWGDAFLTSVWGAAIACGVGAWALSILARRTSGTLEVRSGKLAVVRGDRARLVSAESVAGARILPSPPGHPVTIDLLLESGEELVVSVADAERARELLAEAGISFEKRTSRTTIASSMRPVGLLLALLSSFLAGPLFLPIGGESATGALGWFAAVLTAFTAAVVLTSAPELTIGLDGVRLRTPLVKRFFSFEGVKEVRPTPRGAELVMHDGSVKPIHFFTVSTPHRIAQRDATVEQIADAIEQRERAAGTATAIAAIAREGRSVASWRETIQRLATEGGYRMATLPYEGLAEVLARPDSSAEDRIGAAIALTAKDPEVAKARVRIAAQTCADPRVRIALERVADGADDDQAIEDALAEEETRRRASERSR